MRRWTSKKIKAFLKLDNETIITPKQIHGDSVIRVSENSSPSECDAIIFKANSNIIGTINVADCIPICIYDFDNKNIALVHSGWRGTHKKIILKAICFLEEMGADRKTIKIFLGPSIRGCCYEVDKLFTSKFDSCSIQKHNEKYFVDLSIQVKFDLENAFVPSTNIIIDDLCTYEDVYCHSFRRDGRNAGRMTLVAYKD